MSARSYNPDSFLENLSDFLGWNFAKAPERRFQSINFKNLTNADDAAQQHRRLFLLDSKKSLM
jgi:hypothetical protein